MIGTDVPYARNPCIDRIVSCFLQANVMILSHRQHFTAQITTELRTSNLGKHGALEWTDITSDDVNYDECFLPGLKFYRLQYDITRIDHYGISNAMMMKMQCVFVFKQYHRRSVIICLIASISSFDTLGRRKWQTFSSIRSKCTSWLIIMLGWLKFKQFLFLHFNRESSR